MKICMSINNEHKLYLNVFMNENVIPICLFRSFMELSGDILIGEQSTYQIQSIKIISSIVIVYIKPPRIMYKI